MAWEITMLNGVDPLLVITLKNKGLLDLFGPNSLLSPLVNAIGVPIPIYLGEKLTGIYVESESRSIDVITEVEPTTDKDQKTGEVLPPTVTQTARGTQVTINLLASRNSLLVTAIVALFELVFARLRSGEYSMHYINGPTVIFGGLLNRFATSVSRNDDLLRIELSLSTAAQEKPTPPPPDPPSPKVVEPLPNTAGVSLSS